MSAAQLPRSEKGLFSAFNINSASDIVKLCKKPENLSPDQSIIWKYSARALQVGRPLGTVMVFMAGASGSGKSSTINMLFDDPNLCPTSTSCSETKNPVMLSKRLCVTRESPPVVGQFGIIDVPGTFDTDCRNEVVNMASIRKFKESLVELAPREEMCSTALKTVLSIRNTVYPNLVLFVVKATDNRMCGPDSFFRKSLKAFKKTAKLIDTKYPNLIVVLTHSVSLALRREKFVKMLSQKIEDVRATVAEVLQIHNVDVIPVENEADDYELIKEGDFYKLPNGELSHYNLYQAMLKRFDANKDLLGRLLVGWYFGSNCPERKSKAEVIQSNVELDQTEIARAGLDLQNLNISVSEDSITPIYSFQSLGYGYCPVTEEIKPVSLLTGAGSQTLKVVEVDSTKFLIPECVNAFVKKTSLFHKISFYEKEEYQSHMKASYGIEAGFKLVVSASSEGRWVNNSEGSSSSSLISMVQEIQVATFKVQNPRERVSCPTFSTEINNLPEEYTDDTAREFRSFFSRWGSHLIHEQAVGGAVQLNCTMDRASLSKAKFQEIQVKVSGLFSALTASAQTSHSTQTNAMREMGVSNEHLQIDGGDPPGLVTLETMTTSQLQEWSKTVGDKPAELSRSIKLYPYYNFLENGKRYEALRQATSDYMGDTLESRIKAKVAVTREEASKDAVDRAVEEKSNNCFPKGTLVDLANGERKRIEDLGLGHQKIKTISSKKMHLGGEDDATLKLGKTTFCTFLDKKPNGLVEYLVLHFENGKKLIVSEAHMIFQYLPDGGLLKGKQAKYFQVGEMALYSSPDADAVKETPRVTHISREMHEGAYSPLTTSGTFFADGFFVSSYANTDSFSVAQAALLPLKMWCKVNIKKQDKNIEGIHPFAKFLMTTRKSVTSLVPNYKK